jgi:hypothetical protein
MTDEKKEKDKTFWQTLPGILTALTSLIVAITGLITVLKEGGPLNPTPTEFPTTTPVDVDVTLPPPVVVTPEPTDVDVVVSAPTCTAFTEFERKVNPNAVLLAFSATEFWVQYGGIDEDLENNDDLTAYIFDTSENAANCLRSWVKYLLHDRTPHWPTATTSTGRTNHEVWLSSPLPPLVGELASWPSVPNTILISTVNEHGSPDSAQIYLCGGDIPGEVLGKVAYWHAATSEQALEGHLEQYQSNGYTQQPTVPCGN